MKRVNKGSKDVLKLPLDCWGSIIQYFCSNKDFVSVSMVIKGLYEHIQTIFPKGCENIKFRMKVFPKGNDRVKHVKKLRVRIRRIRTRRFGTKSFEELLEEVFKAFENVSTIQFIDNNDNKRWELIRWELNKEVVRGVVSKKNEFSLHLKLVGPVTFGNKLRMQNLVKLCVKNRRRREEKYGIYVFEQPIEILSISKKFPHLKVLYVIKWVMSHDNFEGLLEEIQKHEALEVVTLYLADILPYNPNKRIVVRGAKLRKLFVRLVAAVSKEKSMIHGIENCENLEVLYVELMGLNFTVQNCPMLEKVGISQYVESLNHTLPLHKFSALKYFHIICYNARWLFVRKIEFYKFYNKKEGSFCPDVITGITHLSIMCRSIFVINNINNLDLKLEVLKVRSTGFRIHNLQKLDFFSFNGDSNYTGHGDESPEVVALECSECPNLKKLKMENFDKTETGEFDNHPNCEPNEIVNGVFKTNLRLVSLPSLVELELGRGFAGFSSIHLEGTENIQKLIVSLGKTKSPKNYFSVTGEHFPNLKILRLLMEEKEKKEKDEKQFMGISEIRNLPNLKRIDIIGRGHLERKFFNVYDIQNLGDVSVTFETENGEIVSMNMKRYTQYIDREVLPNL